MRSKDVIFFEDQTIEDFEQKEKTGSTFIPSNSNPRPTPQLPLMPANHGGDMQNDDNGGFLIEPLVGVLNQLMILILFLNMICKKFQMSHS